MTTMQQKTLKDDGNPPEKAIEPLTIKGELLGDGGWGSDHKMYLGEIERCKSWIIENATPTKTITKQSHSYWLKHVVEKRQGKYVSNGSFIKAAIDLGYRYRIHESGLNCNFNMRLR